MKKKINFKTLTTANNKKCVTMSYGRSFRKNVQMKSFFSPSLQPVLRIRNEFFHIMDPDPYQNDTDPQHCLPLLTPYVALAVQYDGTWLC